MWNLQTRLAVHTECTPPSAFTNSPHRSPAAQVIPGGAGPPWRGGCSPTTSANGDYSEGALRNRPPVVGSKAATKGAGY
eukprot:2406397-Pyramimonas_sp.AAC.1